MEMPLRYKRAGSDKLEQFDLQQDKSEQTNIFYKFQCALAYCEAVAHEGLLNDQNQGINVCNVQNQSWIGKRSHIACIMSDTKQLYC